MNGLLSQKTRVTESPDLDNNGSASQVDPQLKEVFPFISNTGQIHLSVEDPFNMVAQMRQLSEKLVILYAENKTLKSLADTR